MCIYAKGFTQLIKTQKFVFATLVTVYIVLVDGWYKSEFTANTDQEAIEKFMKGLRGE